MAYLSAYCALLYVSAGRDREDREGFEPTVGEAGHDIVWVQTPHELILQDARHGRIDTAALPDQCPPPTTVKVAAFACWGRREYLPVTTEPA